MRLARALVIGLRHGARRVELQALLDDRKAQDRLHHRQRFADRRHADPGALEVGPEARQDLRAEGTQLTATKPRRDVALIDVAIAVARRSGEVRNRMQLPVDEHEVVERDVVRLKSPAELALAAHALHPLLGVALAVKRLRHSPAAAPPRALARLPPSVRQPTDAHATPRLFSSSRRAETLPGDRARRRRLGASSSSPRSLGATGTPYAHSQKSSRRIASRFPGRRYARRCPRSISASTVQYEQPDSTAASRGERSGSAGNSGGRASTRASLVTLARTPIDSLPSLTCPASLHGLDTRAPDVRPRTPLRLQDPRAGQTALLPRDSPLLPRPGRRRGGKERVGGCDVASAA